MSLLEVKDLHIWFDLERGGGMTVTPGFIDAHSHPASGGVRELVSVNLDLRSIGAIQDA